MNEVEEFDLQSTAYKDVTYDASGFLIGASTMLYQHSSGASSPTFSTELPGRLSIALGLTVGLPTSTISVIPIPIPRRASNFTPTAFLNTQYV